MPVDLSKSLVIGISSRALFDLEEADRVYENEGIEAYAAYQESKEDEILAPGIGFRLIQAIQGLNARARGTRKAEVVIASRNSPATDILGWTVWSYSWGWSGISTSQIGNSQAQCNCKSKPGAISHA
jgi:hypothetical protein